MEILQAKILDAADPVSVNYGKWLKPTEVLDLIAPEAEVVQSIVDWLVSNGIAKVDASGRDVIKAEATVSQIEKLFKTQMYRYRHIESGKIMNRHFGDLNIPDEFQAHVELISGLSQLYGPSHIKPVRKPIPAGKRNDVSAGYIIPANLRKIYSTPSVFWVNQQSSICVAEFQDDASYADSDNTLFNQQMNENIAVSKVVGPFNPSAPDGESTLDVQYAFAMGLNATTWFWTVDGWMYEFATDLFGTKTPPLVVSMSWGWPEDRQCEIDSCSDSKQYVTRVNNEFSKITGTGVTLLAASGDQGAPGDSNPYCDNTATPLSTIFPGASPWVLSVGATMTNPQGSPNNWDFSSIPACQQQTCTTISSEVVCTYPTSLITTGGGFSLYTPRPSWQSAAVTTYLNSGVALPPSNTFTAANRGFPDVAANGHAYLIAIDGSLEQVDGTSCSSPVFGAVVSLLNDWRLDQGKTPLGFFNPVAYAAAAKGAFIDITSGNNMCTESCCSTTGFTATTGWDPATGVGTPNFISLLNYVQTLP